MPLVASTDVPPLVANLGALLHSPPTSIEILPGDGSEFFRDRLFPDTHKPFLFDEGNLGVPQKVLYEAYLLAMPTFTRANRLVSSPLDSDGDRMVSLESLADLLRLSTSVILLANPAHSTALSTRRKMVRKEYPFDNICDSTMDPHTELVFIRALLCGGTRECAKSSILWNYRLSILHLLHCSCQLRSPPDHASRRGPQPARSCSECDVPLPLNVIAEELEMVSRACEVYPRNYHAWSYRTSSFLPLLRTEATDPEDIATFVQSEIDWGCNWLNTHVSDYSTINHLTLLLKEYAEFTRLRRPQAAIGDTDLRRNGLSQIICQTFEHALSLLESYPSHESLWLYLRACISTLEISTPDMMAKLSPESGNKTSISDAIRRTSAISRLSMYEASTTSALVHWNHARFLAWYKRTYGDDSLNSQLNDPEVAMMGLTNNRPTIGSLSATSSLPREVFLSLFSYLKAESETKQVYQRTLLATVAINRLWHTVAVTFLYKDIRIQTGDKWNLFRSTLEESELGALVETLHIDGFDPGSKGTRPTEDALTDTIMSKCTNLRELTLDLTSFRHGWHYSIPPHPLDYVSRLYSLSIGPSTDAHWLLDALAEGTVECPNLVELSINGASAFPAETNWPSFPRLTRLTITKCILFSNGLAQLLSRAAASCLLKELTLRDLMIIPKPKATFAWPDFPSLLRLTLRKIKGLGGEARLADFFPSAPKLVALDVAVVILQHDRWDSLPCRSQALRELTLGIQDFDSSPFLSLFIALASGLTTLSIHDCRLVLDSAFLPTILTAAPTLVSLTLLAFLPLELIPSLPSFSHLQTLRASCGRELPESFLLFFPPSIRYLELRCTMPGRLLKMALRSLLEATNPSPSVRYPHLKRIHLISKFGEPYRFSQAGTRRFEKLGVDVTADTRGGSNFLAP